MRTFIIKLLNVILIAGIIWVYQSHAMEQKEREDAYKRELAEYKQAKMALEKPYQNGVYEGVGNGFGGDIKVQVTVEDNRIKKITIVSAEKETPEYLHAAKEVIKDVVDTQSANVDGVAGATLSSRGILKGVKEALRDSTNGKSKNE